MTNFWQNLKRFPKFIIGVIIGLIVVIITPIIRMMGTSRNQYLIPLIFLIATVTICLVLKTMLQLS
nr:ORF47 [Cavernulicola chilensis]